jgi:hypothetical protein
MAASPGRRSRWWPAAAEEGHTHAASSPSDPPTDRRTRGERVARPLTIYLNILLTIAIALLHPFRTPAESPAEPARDACSSLTHRAP